MPRELGEPDHFFLSCKRHAIGGELRESVCSSPLWVPSQLRSALQSDFWWCFVFSAGVSPAHSKDLAVFRALGTRSALASIPQRAARGQQRATTGNNGAHRSNNGQQRGQRASMGIWQTNPESSNGTFCWLGLLWLVAQNWTCHENQLVAGFCWKSWCDDRPDSQAPICTCEPCKKLILVELTNHMNSQAISVSGLH